MQSHKSLRMYPIHHLLLDEVGFISGNPHPEVAEIKEQKILELQKALYKPFLSRMEEKGWIEIDSIGPQLTAEGKRVYAIHTTPFIDYVEAHGLRWVNPADLLYLYRQVSNEICERVNRSDKFALHVGKSLAENAEKWDNIFVCTSQSFQEANDLYIAEGQEQAEAVA